MVGEKKDDHLEMALAIADDQTISRFQDDDSMGSRLRKLDGLAEVFRSFGERESRPQTEIEDPLFKWGHLQVVEHMGKDSFGDVYQAFDPSLQRAVVLKLWNKHGSGFASENHTIEEARRLARVRHPNVHAVHGADIHNGQAGFWADLLEGENLCDLLKGSGGIDVEEVMEIGISLVGALDAVHQAGLVHGDVKPANVMKEASGRVVLMDFGTGRVLLKGGRSFSPGTPVNMAPEIFSGANPNNASDMYSMGVLLYFLLTGTYPVKANNLEGFFQAHRAGGRRNLSRARAGLPRALVNLVERLLDPKPHRRPSALQVRDRLRWIRQRPQRRVRNFLLTAIVCSLFAGAGVSTWNLMRAKRAAGQAAVAKNHTDKVNQFLQNMLALPSPSMKGPDVKVVEILNKAANDAEAQFANHPEALSTIQSTLGVTYLRLGEFETARQLLVKSLVFKETILGQSHIDTLRVKIWLGDVLNRLAQFAEAETLLSEVAESGAANYGSYHEVTLWAQTRLAASITELRGPQEAITLIRKVLRKWEESQLETSAKYQALQELGSQLGTLGKYQRACQVNRQVAQWYLREQGEDHPDTIGAWGNLGGSLARLGQLEEAEAILQALEPRSRRIMGPDNFVTLAILNSLGSLHSQKGQYAEAGRRFQEVYEHCLDSFGPRHPSSITVMGNLANALRYGGYHGEALELQRETLRLKSEVLGRSHPDTLMTMTNLAELWVETGQPERGEQLACEAYDYLISSFGPDHLFALEARDILGTALADLGLLKDAEMIHREILAKKRVLFGKSKPILMLTLDRLAMVLEKQSSHQELTSLYGEIHDNYRQIHGSDHPLTHKAKLALDEARERYLDQERAMAQ